MVKYITINNRKIIGRPEFLECIFKAHKEIRKQNIDIVVEGAGYSGLLIGAIKTSSWRSEKIQRELYNSGISPVMVSNHRKGTAIDVFPDNDYVERIQLILRSYGLVNDIPGDAVHFNYKSNDFAKSFDIIDKANPREYKNMIIKKTNDSPHIYLIVGNKKIKLIDMPTYEVLNEEVEVVESLVGYEDGGTFVWVDRPID